MLLNEVDRTSESGGSIIAPLTLSFTFGLKRPRVGDQPQKVLQPLPLTLTLRRLLGQEEGWFAVGGVLARFSLDNGDDAVVVNAVNDDVDDDLRRRLTADDGVRETLIGVATLPKFA